MHALVSTPRFILLVDLTTGKVEAVEGHRQEYYGISWFPGSSDLVLSHSGTNNAGLVDIASYAMSEVGFLSEGRRRSGSFLSQPHQIVCGFDGRIIVTNTGRNRIQIIDLDRPGHLQEAGISEGRWDRFDPEGRLGDHLNSVFERDGRLYAIAHGHRNGSQLAIFSYPDMNLISLERIPNITGVHNVFVEESETIVGCHSDVGALINLKNGDLLWQSGSAVYTRGLAASADHLFIGESEITVRENRVSCPGGIWIVDRHTLKTQDYVPLGPYGAVHEVRLIDVPDYAHHRVPLLGGRHALDAYRVSDVFKAARLRASQAVEKNSCYWNNFLPVLGTVDIDENGWKSTELELFLAVRRDSALLVAVNYKLNFSEGSHISLIAGYRGNGADANMDAFLLHGGKRGATLQLWRHEGVEWKVDLSIFQTDLPLSGHMELRIVGDTASIFLNGEKIVIDAALQGHGEDGGRLGVRFREASVRPIELAGENFVNPSSRVSVR